VRDVAGQLRELGLKVFFDEDSVEPGEPVVRSLERGLQSSRRVLLVLSLSSLKSRWVALERIITQHEDPDAEKKRLVPVLLEPVKPKRIPAAIRSLNTIDLTNPATRNQRYAFLLKHLGVPENQIPAPPPWSSSKTSGKKRLPVGAARKTKVAAKKRSTSLKSADGKTMILIKGDDNVNDFYIDEYPVTNAEYARFLDEEKRRPPRYWKSGRYRIGKADHPVTGVDFYGAKGYAQYFKKRLPTEKEWERAAIGNRSWKYPWGKKFDKSRCNTSESGIKETSAVTKYQSGASTFGITDMSGNAWEWVDTWARDDDKKVKGGSYKFDQYAARVSNSESHAVSSGRPADVGFRCVMDIT
jgi:hypothetical protein